MQNQYSEVPRLATAMQHGPVPVLEQVLLQNQHKIESWLREQWRLTRPPFYASVDLRNAGFKVAPIDTNLFPAGFNNLNPEFIPLCIQAVQATISEICAEVDEILLIPESHTRNIYYLENMATLQEILNQAGFDVRVGSLIPELAAPQKIELPSGKSILLEPLIRLNNKVGVKDFFPCLVLLNNDLSGGVPEILQNLTQKVMPPLALSWATRFKSTHFRHYQQVATEFAAKIGIDSWLIMPLFRQCGEIDFMTGEGETCLIENVSALLEEIQKKYDEYGITQKPFVVVKADAGTYGMAVMMVQDVAEIQHLNRKQRTHMAKVKSGKPVTQVIIQEGIYTVETRGDARAVAEPVVYMIGRHVVGGFYRVHNERSSAENLNAPGMHFEPLAFDKPCNNPMHDKSCDEAANRFYIYGVIARLALVAATREIAEVKG